LNVAMSKGLRTQFHKTCLDSGRTMQEVVTALVEAYVRRRVDESKLFKSR
jgi:hypothetical protein